VPVKVLRRLERDVFPWVGGKPIATLTAPDVLAVPRRIEGRGAVETAHRVHQYCGQVLRYAVATGRAQGDVTRDLRGSLTPWKSGHFASLTEPGAVGELLRATHGFTGTFPVACALKLPGHGAHDPGRTPGVPAGHHRASTTWTACARAAVRLCPSGAR